MNQELVSYFEQHVTAIPETGCAIWLGPEGTKGYGQTTFNKKSIGTHRLAWIAYFGPIPSGLWVLHKCDTPLCCNPYHLFLGTCTDNNRDASKKGRLGGESHPNAKLTIEAVRLIRSSDIRTKELMKLYGVTKRTIRDVRLNRIWKHVAVPDV